MIYFLGIVLGVTGSVVFCAYASRTTKIFAAPVFVWWLCVLGAIVATALCALKSTAPSIAPRITVTGRAVDCATIPIGKRGDFKNIFRFDPEYGRPVWVETHIMGPMCWASSKRSDRRTYRIVYLDDEKRNFSNEAISIEVVSGPDSGWHEAVDARPMGIWLGVPIAAALGYIGVFGTNYRRRINSLGSAPNEPTNVGYQR